MAASRILLPAAAFMFLSNFGETALACVNRWGTIVVVSTLALVVNVALNLGLIPRLGFVGSAWATLVTEALYFLAGAVALRSYGYRAGWVGIAWRPVLATAAFAARPVAGAAWPLVGASLVACAAYAAATVLLGVWDERERELMLGVGNEKDRGCGQVGSLSVAGTVGAWRGLHRVGLGRETAAYPSRDQGTTPSRHVPNRSKRVAWQRDGGQCAFVAPGGLRCEERAFVELHHMDAHALGGPANPRQHLVAVPPS